MWIYSWVGRYMYNGCGTFPHVPDETRINMYQDSYLVSISFIMLFILVQCVEMKLESTSGI